METAVKAGRYEILGELGRGGMGVVYRAKDPVIGRNVAIKAIRLSEEGTGMSHAQLVERFQTEARAAGRLTHPNIVMIHDAGETDGLYYIALELVNGKSLQSMLDSGQKFPLPRLLQIMEQVCSALQFAHDNGVVHRDIKPANIMLTGEDSVKITDFGTAKILQYGTAQQTAAMGTPGYMSPEQIKGKAVDGRSDIFSLGVLLYEMTTGQKPFRGQDVATILYRILNEEPAPPNQMNPSVPLGVSSAIMKALTKSPHLRYENCRDLLEDLKNYRPGDKSANANATPSSKIVAARPPTPELVEKSFKPEMPRIPGVEPRAASPATPLPRPASPSADTGGNYLRTETGQQASDVYTELATKQNLPAIKRMATIGACVLLAAGLGYFGVRTISRTDQSDLDAPSARQDGASSTQPESTESDSAQKPIYASPSNPDVATVSELEHPWSSKRFLFRGLTQSKYVPALIIRLPGPASQSNSYWAFSLEVPFNPCQFEYVDDIAKLSSDYEFKARHPMVVNPCSRTVFDPLQLKEIPGNTMVRGAIVHGNDLRPPYGIEVKVSGNQILALAME